MSHERYKTTLAVETPLRLFSCPARAGFIWYDIWKTDCILCSDGWNFLEEPPSLILTPESEIVKNPFCFNVWVSNLSVMIQTRKWVQLLQCMISNRCHALWQHKTERSEANLFLSLKFESMKIFPICLFPNLKSSSKTVSKTLQIILRTVSPIFDLCFLNPLGVEITPSIAGINAATSRALESLGSLIHIWKMGWPCLAACGKMARRRIDGGDDREWRYHSVLEELKMSTLENSNRLKSEAAQVQKSWGRLFVPRLNNDMLCLMHFPMWLRI